MATNQLARWAVLGDRTRRTIFERLTEPIRSRPSGQGPAGQPAGRLAAPQGAQEGGLVVDHAAGTRRIYAINPDGLSELRAELDRFWTRAMTAYKAVVERPDKGEP